MGFNSAFKGLKLLKKTPGNGRLNNLNDPVLNVLTLSYIAYIHTSVTLLTSRDFLWSSGRLTCQHASHISAVAHVRQQECERSGAGSKWFLDADIVTMYL